MSGTVNKITVLGGSTIANQVWSLAFESLLTMTPSFKLAPLLAQTWSQPDPLTLVFTLRQDVKFWDGTPLTADDVVYSLSQLRDPANGSFYAHYFNSVDTIQATSQSQVTIKMKTADPLFIYALTLSGTNGIVSKRFYEAHGGPLGADIGTAPNMTMATGPYRFSQFQANTSVELQRNEAYWGPKPAAKTIRFHEIVDPGTRLLAMRSGDIDGSFSVPLDQVSAWKSISNVTVLSAPSSLVGYFDFDSKTPPWNDIHVRRACAHALDKKGLVNAVLGGHGTVAESVVPPIYWNGLLPQTEIDAIYATLPQYPFDLGQAKAELAQSSVPKGFSWTVSYINSQPALGLAAQSLSQNLKQIGIDLTVKEEPTGQWFDEISKHFGGIIADYGFGVVPDPMDNIKLHFDSSNAVVPDGPNDSNYSNPDVDALIQEAFAESDPHQRAQTMAKILRIVGDDLPELPYWFQDTVMAIKDKYVIKNFGDKTFTQNWAGNISVR